MESDPQTSRARVLVVDDNEGLRRSVRRMLAPTYDVVDAADGEAAVSIVESGERLDLVLMDLEMPRMDGRRALERLQDIAPTLAAHTVIMSGGSGDAYLRTWFEKLGEERSIAKPFKPMALLALLERTLRT